MASTNKKRKICIWAEGYYATGERGGASFIGTEFGSSLKEACDAFAKRSKEFAIFYNPERMTFWGCKLFDNEADARQHFG